MEYGLEILTQCASPLGVVPSGGADYFLIRMTDFGAKNCVFELKTLSLYISSP